MARVVHVIESLWLGGGALAMIAAAKYSRRLGPYEHTILPLSRSGMDEKARQIAAESGVDVALAWTSEERAKILADADIVQLSWWNSPVMDDFLRSPLPPMRLAGWYHVGGARAPQWISRELVDFCDLALGCSPYTYACPAIQSLPPEERVRKTGMAYGGADFARVEGVTPRPHTGFNVGYIGTIDFVKMHPRYVEMSAAIEIPNARFVVCGSGSAQEALRSTASKLGVAGRFEVRGHVEDIRSVLSELDVYGYPLCEDTYAASECNLQEVMYAGIPVVVFPHGGISKLVVNDFTGLVVTSELEYRQAIEHLYHHPEERARIGANAREYARQIFGAENAAKKLNEYYAEMMRAPKRTRIWGVGRSVVDAEVRLEDLLLSDPALCGAQRFVDSLGPQGEIFRQSMIALEDDELFAADNEIRRGSELMRSGGILNYLRHYPTDPYLSLWAGLTEAGRGVHEQALVHFSDALSRGATHWRVLWYIAVSAEKVGMRDVAIGASKQVLDVRPTFEGARALLRNLGIGASAAQPA